MTHRAKLRELRETEGQRAALARLDTADPRDPRELGFLPLPVSCVGLKLGVAC